jgi:hypothetical protein
MSVASGGCPELQHAPVRPSGKVLGCWRGDRTLKLHRAWLAAALLLVAPAAEPATPTASGRFEVELELGPVWQSSNDVEIPNDGTATRFSLEQLVGAGPWPAGRTSFVWNVAGRHSVRFMVALLSYTDTGSFDEQVLFAGEAYAPGVPTEATYQFDSWRASYRYQFQRGDRWNAWVGFTAFLRDAEIALEQGSTFSNDTDLGFVPLLYLRGDWRFAEGWHLLMELDALAGGPGRAEDLSLKLGRDLGDQWTVSFGYRTVEGGVDIDTVYNFAWFNSAVVSGAYRWGARR